MAEVHDFMPLLAAHDEEHRQRIVRRVFAVRGTREPADDPGGAARLRPGHARPRAHRRRGAASPAAACGSGLTATTSLESDDGVVTAECTLSEGSREALFCLEVLDEDQDVPSADEVDGDHLFERTAAYWRDWIGRSTYRGRWRETVNRSALTLKLLTHEPTGAMIASPTTSLPEAIGGSRNWDYRYVWIRDAAFSLYALLRLGFTDEADALHALALEADEPGP